MIVLALASVAILPLNGRAFSQCFDEYSGKNAYEDYLMAADIVSGWQPARAISNYYKIDPIEADRKAVRDLGRACDLIRIGNRKPANYPLDDDPFTMSFAHVVGYKEAAKLLLCEARVRLADGDKDGATQSLIDNMAFANQVDGVYLMDYLGSVAIWVLTLREFDHQKEELTGPHLRNLRTFLEHHAEETPAVLGPIEKELTAYEKQLPQLFLGPLSDDGSGDVPKEVAKLNRYTAAPYYPKVVAELKKERSEISTMLAGPVSSWRVLRRDHPDPVIRYFLELGPPGEITTVAAAKHAIRVRLAILHCHVMEFKIEHGRLPAHLAELGPADLSFDEASQDQFEYVRRGGNYVLFSKGSAVTGKVELTPPPKPEGA